MIDELAGTVLRERFEITKFISSGAFGKTYLGIDRDNPFKSECLIKYLCPINPTNIEIAQKLFKIEASCLSKLGEHPQIPRLLSYFEAEGKFYLVQELVKGEDLTSEFISGERWSEAKTVQFLQELLSILSVVHQNGTIHRDIKPANMMRCQETGKLVLIDFGAVKESVRLDETGMTMFSSIAIGTPPYMSPEQAMAKPEKSSDIYAVGILAIQALTGLTSRELMDLSLDSENLERLFKEHHVSVSFQLKYVLGRMVSFQCKQRYRDADEALKALVPTVTDSGDKAKTGIQRKLLVGLLGVLGLTGIGFTAGAILNKPNYTQLEAYLENKEWEKADAETDRLLLKIADEQSALDSDSISKFPCKSLAKIDELWTSSSDGRFGFTAQKNVYSETGNKFDKYTRASYEAFGNQVKWRILGEWDLYGDLKFNNIAPIGHLPSPGRMSKKSTELCTRERGMLLSRFDDCGL